MPDEERIDALLQEGEVVEGQVAGLELLPAGVEVEVERIDGVHFGEARIVDAALDGPVHPALPLLVAQPVGHVERGEVLLGRFGEELPGGAGHARELEPAQLLEQQFQLVLVARHAFSVGGSPGSSVLRGAS